MSLTSLIKNTWISFVGNRLNLLAISIGIPSIYALDTISHDQPYQGMLALVGLGIGLLTTGASGCGSGTKKFYRFVERNIERTGDLDQKFLERLISLKTENRSLFGYCQLQGMYLAARDYNQLEVFNQAKNNVSNCKIPNF